MDWKLSNAHEDWSVVDIYLESRGNKELPSTEIQSFIRTLVDRIVFQKQSAWLILPDSWPTHPESYEELIALIQFSFQTLIRSWSRIFKKYNIQDIPLPSLNIISPWEKSLNKFLWLCYLIPEETIQVDPFFVQFFHHKIYRWAEDFSIMYAIAHEIAHHIQKYLFWSIEVSYTHEKTLHTRSIDDVLDLRIFSLMHHFESDHQAEQIVELHADYLAWVIIHHANKHKPFLHENDIREWLETALHVWDDLQQWKAWKEITPHTFKHGRCDQRVLAFAAGLESGDVFRFTLKDIADIFFEQWAEKEADISVSMF